jgi:hypothetical protein
MRLADWSNTGWRAGHGCLQVILHRERRPVDLGLASPGRAAADWPTPPSNDEIQIEPERVLTIRVVLSLSYSCPIRGGDAGQRDPNVRE